MESQELTMQDLVTSLDERFRERLSEAFGKMRPEDQEDQEECFWNVICEQIEQGDLQMKKTSVHLSELLLGNDIWPVKCTSSFLDNTLTLYVLIVEEPIDSEYKEELLAICTHLSTSAIMIAGVLQDTTSCRLLKSPFAKLDPPDLLYLLLRCMKVVKHENFPKLLDQHRRGVLEFMRGIYNLFRLFDGESQAIETINPAALSKFASKLTKLCSGALFRLEGETGQVLDVLLWLIMISGIILGAAGQEKEFYRYLGMCVKGNIGDGKILANILTDAVPFDDSAVSSIPALLLNAVSELRGHNFRVIYFEYRDHIFRRLIDRLIKRVNDGQENVQQTIQLYFEKAAKLFGYNEGILKNWLQRNGRYIIPHLLLCPSTASSAIHQTIAKLCDTNRHNLIIDNIPHLLVRMTLQELDQSQLTAVNEFVESEGSKERRFVFTEYVGWQLYACVNELLMHLAAAKDRVIDTLARISLVVARKEEVSDAEPAATVIKFVRIRLLGVLSQFLGKFTSRCPFAEKLLALRSLVVWMGICAGDILSEVSAKMMATLRAASAIDDERLRPDMAAAWKAFLTNVSPAIRKEVVLPVFVATTPLLFDKKDDVKAIVEDLLRYIFVNQAPYLEEGLIDIAFLAKNIDSKLLRRYCPDFDDQVDVPRLLEICLKLFKHEHPDVKRLLLERLKTLLRRRSKEFYKLILEPDNVDESIDKLIKTLTSALHHSDSGVRRLAAVCMGDLGAVDPGRFRTGSISTNALLRPSELAFPDFDGLHQSTRFPIALLGEVTRLLMGASDSFYDVCSFTLQKILAFYGCRDGGINRVDKESGVIWSKLDEATKKILTPFLTTDYKSDPKEPSFDGLPSPLFGSEAASSLKPWVTIWLASLTKQVQHAEAKRLFTDLSIMANINVDFAQFLLPHVILQRIVEGKDVDRVEMLNELLAAMSGVSHSGQSVNDVDFERCASHVVFCVLDFLYKWTLEMQNTPISVPGQKIVEKFINLVPKETASIRAATFEAYPRALMYCEKHIENESRSRPDTVGSAPWCEHLRRVQEIYVKLNDVDGVVGALIVLKRHGQNVDKEQVLALEASGNYMEALPFWEAAACATHVSEAEKIDSNTHLVNCFLRLNQSTICERYLSDLFRTSPEWQDTFHPYRVDALLKLQQWGGLEKELADHSNLATSWPADIGQLLVSARAKNVDAFNEKISTARDHILHKLSLATRDNGTCDGGYGYMLRLHMLSEIDQRAQQLFASNDLDETLLDEMMAEWEQRFNIVQPSMDNLYALLDLRKQILRLGPPSDKTEKAVGACWLEAAKIARKTGHYQTAWNLLVKAKEFGLVDAFMEEAKLLWNKGEKMEAISCLKLGISRHYGNLLIRSTNFDSVPETQRFSFAKAQLLFANYCRQSSAMGTTEIARLYDYLVDTGIFRDWEESHYYTGLHYDQLTSMERIQESSLGRCAQIFCRVMQCYANSLEFGSRYVHHSMPRLLTVWLDATQVMHNRKLNLVPPGSKATKKDVEEYLKKEKAIDDFIKALNNQMNEAIGKVPTYQFYCCFSQLISRICHPCQTTFDLLKEILARLLKTYPHQCVWMVVSVKRSSVQDRSERCKEIVRYAVEKNRQLESIFAAVDKLAELLIGVCERSVDSSTPVLNLKRDFKPLYDFFNNGSRNEWSKVILPLQILLDVTYPAPTPGHSPNPDHKPFNEKPVYIQHFLDDIQVFPTMQRPKRMSLLGSDGEVYSIMCKARDDMRLDKRLMEFTNLVNGCMLRDPEARRRELRIRTYTVTPLSEKCGFVEWVRNLDAMRSVYSRLCKEYGFIFPSLRDLQVFHRTASDSLQKKIEVFEKHLITKHPLLFKYWFPRTFPDPTAWYKARLNYTRTAAVMSMVGFILGLGDRHNENILLDKTCGDIVHVDFNCLFNRGESLEIPEVVPFRLTRNMVDAMGPLGYEGHYRKACEIVMKLMREEAGMLRSVLQTFLHDPLVEWQKSSAPRSTGGRSAGKPRPEEDKANEHLSNIDRRLEGRVKPSLRELYGMPLSVEGQVNVLIQQATDTGRLAQMYIGWGAFI